MTQAQIHTEAAMQEKIGESIDGRERLTLELACAIAGFEETKSMELIKVDDVFSRLKSLDGPDFTFVLIDPYVLRPDYDFEVPNFYEQSLGLSAQCRFKVFNIVALANTIEDSTVNFLAPIIVNFDQKVLAQVILDNELYPQLSQADAIRNYFVK